MATKATTILTEEFLSTNGTVVFDDPTQRFLVALSYWVISMTGLAGNGLVIFAVLRFRRLRTVTNFFVVNLAISDFVGCSLLPPASVPYVTGDLPYSKDFCRIMIGVIHVMFGASVANVALIAVNRYVLIIHPKVRYLRLYRKRNVLLMILTSWIYVAIIVCVAPTFGVGALGYSREYRICGIDTEHPLNTYYTAIRSILLLIPCLFLAITCYVAIFWFVCKSGLNRRKLFRRSNPFAVDKSPVDEIQLKVTRNLFITMCAYVTLIVPYVVVFSTPAGLSFRPWAAVCGTSISCVNPIIYGYGHPHFKEAFHSIFKCNSVEGTLQPFLFWRQGRLPPDHRPSSDPTSQSPADTRESNTVDMTAL